MIKLPIALTLVPILVAIAAAGSVKPKIASTVGGLAAPPTAPISVEELQRHVDMRALPVIEIENLY
jgi:hypothetical protein